MPGGGSNCVKVGREGGLVSILKGQGTEIYHLWPGGFSRSEPSLAHDSMMKWHEDYDLLCVLDQK